MRLPAVVAGTFYPRSPDELTQVLEGYRDSIRPSPLPEGTVGLLLPHAGYRYSGAVAALGYLSLPAPPETVVLVGPSHHVPFGGTSVFEGDSVETPLGDLPVDGEAVRLLRAEGAALTDFPPAWAREHSVEVHFPLVRRFLPGTKVVPLVAGRWRGRDAETLAGALAALARKRRLLVVASSDLSHYPDQATAATKDREFLEAVLTGEVGTVQAADRRILKEGHRELHCTHCGAEPLRLLLLDARNRGGTDIRLLQYRNSGDVTGERDQVVGYAAVAFCPQISS
jgi:AmmeMemoRadiSam system protein B